jgi:hypothetical protein
MSAQGNDHFTMAPFAQPRSRALRHAVAMPIAVLLVLLLALVGCSSGGAADHPAQSEPTVSTPADDAHSDAHER